MSEKKPPKSLDDKLVDGRPMWREIARKIRDRQWRMMEQMEEHGTLWVCIWNKRRLPTAEDEFRDGLMGWEEKQSWFTDQHPDWFVIGGRDEYDDERDAWPYRLTDAGRAALQDRDRYDMEPVYGGMVEPGWTATPLPRQKTETPLDRARTLLDQVPEDYWDKDRPKPPV